MEIAPIALKPNSNNNNHDDSSNSNSVLSQSESGLVLNDSYLVNNLLVEKESNSVFQQLYDEIKWEYMYSLGSPAPRLVHVQDNYNNTDDIRINPNITSSYRPLYRKPLDYQLKPHKFSPTVLKIRDRILDELKLPTNTINQAFIQLYRDGNDNIGDHSDKTLDIAKSSVIVNVSFYDIAKRKTKSKTSPPVYERILQLKNKRKEFKTVKITMKHNSAVIIGWNTNLDWTHGVSKDLRIKDISRINIVFRHIATYLRADGFVFGQGGVFKTQEDLESQVGPMTEERKQWFIMAHKAAREEYHKTINALIESNTAKNDELEDDSKSTDNIDNTAVTTTNNRHNHNNNPSSRLVPKDSTFTKNNQEEQAQHELERLHVGFSAENRSTTQDFDWEKIYGAGFHLIDSITPSPVWGYKP